MTAALAVLPPAVTKEIRALFPTYAAALVTVVVGSFSHSYTPIALGLLAFGLGSVALGAQSFGHEYSHRTLGLLLSQPIDRRRLFLYKFAVLFVMLLTLTAVALLMFGDLLRHVALPHTTLSMLVLTAACGLFVAPWLTLVSRNTVAAIVFTIVIPGLLSTGADLAGGAIYGLQDAAQIDRFAVLVFWRGMIVISAIGAVASWRLFMRLEVIEGHGHAMELPGWLGRRSETGAEAPSRPRHRMWMLLAKELRLQQMAFVVAALFAVLWLSMAGFERSFADAPRLPLNGIAILYGGVLAMLIGSMASAEERHMGTAEWQILLPMPAWQQWTVKAGVALGLAVLLGFVLPAALMRYLSPAGDDIQLPARAWRQAAATVVILASASLYVSSLCSSGVRALVLAFPAMVAAVLYVQTVGETIAPLVFRLVHSAGSRPFLRPFININLLLLPIAGGLVALLTWLAFGNYRWSDRSAARTSKQVLAIAAYITICLVLFLAAQP
jgi:hypothetical protein